VHDSQGDEEHSNQSVRGVRVGGCGRLVGRMLKAVVAHGKTGMYEKGQEQQQQQQTKEGGQASELMSPRRVVWMDEV
jgi:hypothetical protein